MIEFELDGKTVRAKPGSTILEIALDNGKYIPHFCYHKKLSIAANCRMCLVEVEKVNKPLPACATAVTEGMKVHTCSQMAVDAQKGVMEFLLINHPLDCPICDQGGECQLQDLAVGYGRSETRFDEEKRAVSNKDLGPLIRTAMTRCIHCSRCTRFSDEIAGFQELGMGYRNNHVEIMPFSGKTVNSELSGNMIDICPVGALTSKPYQDTARPWELSRRKTISPHDSLGSNLIAQVDKYHKIARILPLENEAINECWLSDRDRFSYEGLYHEERITQPRIKQDGKWINVDWDVALNYAAKSINGVKIDHGTSAIGVLASAISTTEELYLLQKMMRALGVNNLDYRLDQSDFSLDGRQNGVQFLGSSITDFISSKSFLIIGSVLREEQPLLTNRIRQAAKKGSQVNLINIMGQDILAPVANQITVDPREMCYTIAQVLKAVTQISGKATNADLNDVEVSSEAQAIAQNLLDNSDAFIALGKVARTLPDYAKLVGLVTELAGLLNAKFGFLPSLANEVGAQLVGFIPYRTGFNGNQSQGLNARQMLESDCKAYVLLNTELELDSYNSQLAIAALNRAQTVVVMSAYTNEEMLNYADVILPITPFTETAGSYVNMQGLLQKFNGVTRPLGEAKPAWKIIRVLANKFNLNGFEQNSIEDVRSEIAALQDTTDYLSNQIECHQITVNKPDVKGLIRFAISGIYQMDSITRRAKSLQQTALASQSNLAISVELAKQLNVSLNSEVMAKQTHSQAKFKLGICDKLPTNLVLLAQNQSTISFGGNFDTIELISN